MLRYGIINMMYFLTGGLEVKTINDISLIMQHFYEAASQIGGLRQNNIFTENDDKFAQKLRRAMPNGVDGDEFVIFLYDDTVFGGAKEGTVLTNKRIYCKCLMEKQQAVPFDSIWSFRIAKNSYGHQLYAKLSDGSSIKCLEMLNGNCSTTDRFRQIVDVITGMINFICGTHFGQAAGNTNNDIYDEAVYNTYTGEGEARMQSIGGNTQAFSGEPSGSAENLFIEGMDYYNRGDIEQAVRYLSRSADLGNVVAMCRLGNFYNYGRGVSKDIRKSYEWYRKAAAHGSDEGRKMSDRLASMLGETPMYQHQQSVPPPMPIQQERVQVASQSELLFNEGMESYNQGNTEEAVRILTRAAGLGSTAAMCRLGNFYNYGRGVEKDISKSYEWYKKAADLGSDEGQKMSERLSSKLGNNASSDQARNDQLSRLVQTLAQHNEQRNSPFDNVQSVPDPYAGKNTSSQCLMSCKACGSEWNPGRNTSVMKICPFCGSSLDKAPGEEKKDGSSKFSDEMAQAISDIIRDYGRDIIKQSSRFTAMFADYAPKLRQEKKMIEIALAERVADIILDDSLDTDMRYEKFRSRMADTLIREDAAERLINCFASAYGWTKGDA